MIRKVKIVNDCVINFDLQSDITDTYYEKKK